MGRVCARITSIFSFPTHTRAHFARQITKDYKTFSMWLQTKTKLKHRTHYAIFQNRRICANHPAIWLGALCSCAFCYIYTACVLRLLVSVAYHSVYTFLACMGVECVRAWDCKRVWRSCVFISVDVKYIIHYRCICKFICSL